MKQPITINEKRLLDTLDVSSSIGATSNGGMNRLALSLEDKQMRDIFKKWMENAGLEVRVDDLGNMYGRREGKNKDSAAILVGSHLDTQANGGRYDGILGVLMALEVICTLNENNIETKRPIEIVNFTNEEGARFEPPMLGSGGLANVFKREYIYKLKDKDGKTFGEELKFIGYQGNEQNRAKNIHKFIELHIEQGPILVNHQSSIGAVVGIQGMTWLEVEVLGKSSHAGTTPLSMRKDALLMSIKMIETIHNLVKELDDNALVTFGKISTPLGSVNSVSGNVIFSIDIRHYINSIRNYIVETVREKLITIAASEDFGITVSELWDIKTTTFSKEVVESIEQASKNCGYTYERIVSGAGHDAKYMNDIVPSGMIFVPSIDGKSHCEDELTLDEDIIKGANVILNVVYSLANE